MKSNFNKVKYFLSLILVFSLFLTNVPSVYAQSINFSKSDVSNEAYINSYTNCINTKDWKKYSEMQSYYDSNMLFKFLTNDNNIKNHVGLLDVIAAKVSKIKLLPLNEAAKISKEMNLNIADSNTDTYLVAMDIKVINENEYFVNGTTYHLISISKASKGKLITVDIEAPLDILRNDGYGFNDKDEENYFNVENMRMKGKVINNKGENLESSTYSKLSSKAINPISMSTVQSTSFTIPSTIRVYMHDAYYVKTVNFNEYVKNVLPKEWGSGWQYEAYEAGAIAVKMYGWFFIVHHFYTTLQADVYDDAIHNQVYVPGSANSYESSAVDDTFHYIMVDGTGNIFAARHVAGTPGAHGESHTGLMFQNGTQWLALNGWTHFDICRYYYDYGYDTWTNKNIGTIDFQYVN